MSNGKDMIIDLKVGLIKKYKMSQYFTKPLNLLEETLMSRLICTSNHMLKREIWDKFTEFTFLIPKFQKMNEENFPQYLANKHVIPG